VLGVVGLVIGGIWIAAAGVSENMKVTETQNGIISSVTNIRRIISIRDSLSIASGSEIAPSLVSAEAFPSNWIKAGVVKDPFDGALGVVNDLSFSSPRFELHLIVPTSACIKLLVSFTKSASGNNQIDDGLSYVQIRDQSTNAVTLATGVFPITPAQASSGCVANNRIYFTFGYTRIN